MYTLQSEEFFASPTDSVAVVRRCPQSPFPEHSHDFGEIAIVSRGGGMHVINDQAARVSTGSVLYLMPEDRHAFTEVSNLCLTNVMFRLPERYRPLLDTQLSPAFGMDWEIGCHTRKQVESLLANLMQDFEAPALVRACYLEGVFLQLVALLWQNRYSASQDRGVDARTRQLVNYLRGNFTEQIEWEALATRFSLSLRTLHRKVLEQTGTTPMRYLNRLRLEHAAHCLKASSDSVTDIALSSGFEDSNYFSTQFRHEYAQSPSEYRLRHRRVN